MELENKSAIKSDNTTVVVEEKPITKSTSRKLYLFIALLLLLLGAGIGALAVQLLNSNNSDAGVNTAISSKSSTLSASSSVTSSAASSLTSSQTTSALPASNKVSTQFGISMNVPTAFSYREEVGTIIINGENQASPWDRGAYSIVIDKKATATMIADLELGYTSAVPAENVTIGNKSYPSQMMTGGEGTEDSSTYWSVQIVNVDNKFTVLINKKVESVGDGEVVNQPTVNDVNGGLQLLASIKFN